MPSTLQALNNKYQYTEIASNTMNLLILKLVKTKHKCTGLFLIRQRGHFTPLASSISLH